MENKLYIKNMVCPRCLSSVGQLFNDLNIEVNAIQLGEVIVPSEIPEVLKKTLGEELSKKGFELLKDHKSKTIEKIKSIIIDTIHYDNETVQVNFSTLLSEQLHQEYSSLSRLFSSVEGKTIERYILSQKMEKVKELLFYDELTLSEIAFQMNYSSVAYLSSQFKKETGMTTTEFKKLKGPKHQSLDSI